MTHRSHSVSHATPAWRAGARALTACPPSPCDQGPYRDGDGAAHAVRQIRGSSRTPKPSASPARGRSERITSSFEQSISLPPCCHTSATGTTPSSALPLLGGEITSQRTFAGLTIPSHGRLGGHIDSTGQAADEFHFEITSLRPQTGKVCSTSMTTGGRRDVGLAQSERPSDGRAIRYVKLPLNSAPLSVRDAGAAVVILEGPNNARTSSRRWRRQNSHRARDPKEHRSRGAL